MPDSARLLALASFLSLSAAASEPPQAETSPTLETVVVTGVMPGPGLWRVESGERQLWILGTVSPLPRSMKWEALKVGEVLGQAVGSKVFKGMGDIRDVQGTDRACLAHALELARGGQMRDIALEVPLRAFALARLGQRHDAALAR